jgi:uncharacterized protein YlzI (FlbEa/FlbD family)
VLPGLAAQAGGTVAQFIIVTDAKGTKYRLNVAHIASYAGDATDGGCEANIRMLNGINIDVRESVEAIDRLIRNTDRGSILSQ